MGTCDAGVKFTRTVGVTVHQKLCCCNCTDTTKNASFWF